MRDGVWRAAYGGVAAAAALVFLPGLAGQASFIDMRDIFSNPAVVEFDLPALLARSSAYSPAPGDWPYRPFALVLNAALCSGMGWRLLWWRAILVAVHALNSVLTAVLAERVFGLRRPAALFAGLFFAVLPVQAEAVLHLSSSSVVFAAAAVMGSMLFLRAAASAGRGGRIPLGIAVVLALAGCLFNESGCAVIGLAPLCLFAAGMEVRGRESARWYGPVAAAGLIGLLLILILSSDYLLEGLFAPSSYLATGLMVHLGAPLSLARMALFPVHLSTIHLPPLPASPLAGGAFIPAGLVLAAVVLIYWHRDRRAAAAGASWYLLSFAPLLFAPIESVWAEHRAYLGLAGLLIAAAWAVDSALPGLGGGAWQRRAAVVAAAFSVLLMALLCTGRSGRLSSREGALSRAVKVSPGHAAAWNFLGVEMLGRGDCERALAYLALAITRAPEFADPYNSRVECLLWQDKKKQAVRSATAAVTLSGNNPAFWNSLAAALMTDGKLELARNALERALELAPPKDPVRATIRRNFEKLRAKEYEAERAGRESEEENGPE